uniref:Uncharacterized protein n=1 Tax=Globodera rostochiensis TaxID=31243 RepID=A0A914I815_GLORO
MKSFHLFLLFLLLFFVSLPNESNAQFERVRHTFNNVKKAETTNGQSPPIQSGQNVLVNKTADIDEKYRPNGVPYQNAQIFQTENSIGRPIKWNAPIEQQQFVAPVNLPNVQNPPPTATVSPLYRTPAYFSQTPAAKTAEIGRATGHYPSSTPTVPIPSENQKRNSFRVNQQQQMPVGHNQLEGQTTQNQLPISLNQFMETSMGHLTTIRQPIITSNASIADQKSMPFVGVQQQPTATDQPNSSTAPAAQKRQKVPTEYGDKQPTRPIATANLPNISRHGLEERSRISPNQPSGDLAQPPLTLFPNDRQRTAVDNEQSPNGDQTVPEQSGAVSLTSLGLTETGSKKEKGKQYHNSGHCHLNRRRQHLGRGRRRGTKC